MTKTIVIFALLSSLLCCGKKYESVELINIPKAIDTTIDFSLSDLTSSLQYTILESNDSCYIGNTDILSIGSDFIIVYDEKAKKLLHFDREGSYLGNFLTYGRGPNEFFDIGSIDINQKDEILILRNGQYIDILNIDGSELSSIKLDITPNMVRWLSKDVIVLFYSFPRYLHNGGNEIVFINRQGKIIATGLQRKIKNVETGRRGRVRCGRNNNELFYWSHQSDTVYTITKKLEVMPRFVFEHDERHIPVEKYSKKGFRPILDKQYTVESYMEFGDYIFIAIAYDYKWIRAIINRKTNISGNCIKEHNQWTVKGIRNNIDAGAPFWPAKMNHEGVVYAVVDPIDLKDYYNYNLNSKKSYDQAKTKALNNMIINDLNMFSNPIIVSLSND